MLAVALFTVVALRILGRGADPVVVAVAVVAAGLGATLFGTLSRALAHRLERRLFSAQEGRDRSLAVSRGELAALRRRLERAERLAIAGELATAVAHEIKNPLAPIRGYAQLLSGKLSSVDPEVRPVFEKGLEIIREETDRIARRMADLLKVARSDRSASSRDETLDLNRVVIEAALVAEGEGGRAEILRRLDPTIEGVVGCGDEVRGAVLNLLMNAVEATQDQEKATIEVVTRREAERAVIEVIDDGPGIDPLDADRVFQPFITTKKEGTGLGLAIARSSIEAAGGTITLFPRTDRPGAVARITLDLAPRAGPPRSETSSTDDDLTSGAAQGEEPLEDRTVTPASAHPAGEAQP